MVICATAILRCTSTLRGKLRVVGTGGATKEQVQHMVTRLLRLPATPAEDASDAPLRRFVILVVRRFAGLFAPGV